MSKLKTEIREEPNVRERAVLSGLRIGSTLLALSALGLLAAPIAIIGAIPDLTTRESRHALAGALALVALALMEILLAVIPVRRGERWAMYAAALPPAIVGIPILAIDAANVTPQRLWNTLAPQGVGLALGLSSLIVCFVSVARRSLPTRDRDVASGNLL